MTKPDEIQTMFKELAKAHLNSSQAQFIKGLRKWYKQTGTLSGKQSNCLKSIYSTDTPNLVSFWSP